MPTLDYIVIFLFMIMVFFAGMAFTRSGISMKSYFAAGGALPWWLSGLSLFMSFFSAGTFVVWGSIAYEYGWVAISIQWMMAIGGFIIGFFIAPRWRNVNILTVGEYIGRRFGNGLNKFYSYIFLLLSFLTTGAFLYPVAKIFNVSTGFSIEASILGLGLLIIAYTAAGGLWAVIITDVLQFVILFAAVIIVVPLAFGEIGGIKSFIDQSPTDFFKFVNGEYTFGFLVAFMLYNTLFVGGNWAYVQRYTSVKSPKDAKKVGWLFGVLYLISPVLWMLPAMIYRTLNADLAGLENEGAFLLICKQVLPNGLLGFATASSVNTTLNMSAAVFTNDILRTFRTNKDQGVVMIIAKVSTVVFGLITIGVALAVPHFGGIVEVVLTVGAITGAPLFAPPIWALFSMRQTAISIVTTTLLSLAINTFLRFISPWLFSFALNRAEEMLVGVLGPLCILTLFELYFYLRRAPIRKPAPYQMESQTVDKEKGPSDENQFAKRVLGITLFATGLLICILGLIADRGGIFVVLMGALIIAIGMFFWFIKQIRNEST